MLKNSILVIENDPQSLDAIRNTLETAGHEVHVSESAVDCVSMARELKPSLLLINLAAPGTNGLDICKTIHTDESLKEMPIILLTLREGKFDTVYTKLYGIVAFLNKPFKSRELISTVKEHLLSANKTGAAAGQAIPDLTDDVYTIDEIDDSFNDIPVPVQPIEEAASSFDLGAFTELSEDGDPSSDLDLGAYQVAEEDGGEEGLRIPSEFAEDSPMTSFDEEPLGMELPEDALQMPSPSDEMIEDMMSGISGNIDAEIEGLSEEDFDDIESEEDGGKKARKKKRKRKTSLKLGRLIYSALILSLVGLMVSSSYYFYWHEGIRPPEIFMTAPEKIIELKEALPGIAAAAKEKIIAASKALPGIAAAAKEKIIAASKALPGIAADAKEKIITASEVFKGLMQKVFPAESPAPPAPTARKPAPASPAPPAIAARKPAPPPLSPAKPQAEPAENKAAKPKTTTPRKKAEGKPVKPSLAPATAKAAGTTYYVQFGAFRYKDNAVRFHRKLERHGLKVFIKKTRTRANTPLNLVLLKEEFGSFKAAFREGGEIKRLLGINTAVFYR